MNHERYKSISRSIRISITTLIVLLFVFPLLIKLLEITTGFPIELYPYLKYAQYIQIYSMRLLGLIWIFFLGGCFASFLNVVAWRIPRGKGLNGNSHCPNCDIKLGFLDNLPIVGWLRVGGECRNCHSAIPSRYIIAEATLGITFVGMAYLEVLSGGRSLPLRPIEHLKGLEHLILTPKWELIGIWAFHSTLLASLFTFGLIRSECVKIPFKIFLVMFATGILAAAFYPVVLVVPFWTDQTLYAPIKPSSLEHALTPAIGILTGLFFGWFVNWMLDNNTNPSRFPKDQNYVSIRDSMAGFVLVGLFLGWQSCLSVGLILSGILWLRLTIKPKDQDHFNAASEPQNTLDIENEAIDPILAPLQSHSHAYSIHAEAQEIDQSSGASTRSGENDPQVSELPGAIPSTTTGEPSSVSNSAPEKIEAALGKQFYLGSCSPWDNILYLLMIAVLIHLFLWRILGNSMIWPSGQSSLWTAIFGVIAFATSVALLKYGESYRFERKATQQR